RVLFRSQHTPAAGGSHRGVQRSIPGGVGVGRSDSVGFLSSAARLGTMVSLPYFRPVVTSSTAPGRIVVYRGARLRRFHSGSSRRSEEPRKSTRLNSSHEWISYA